MNRSMKPLIALAMAAGLGVGLLGCGAKPPSTNNREAIRILLCSDCGFVEEATTEVIQQRHEEGQVGKLGPLGPRFGCSDCGVLAADLVVVDLSFVPFLCTDCDAQGPRNAADVLAATGDGGAQLTRTGELQFRCTSCETFTCVQTQETNEELEP